jgi:hypothetical protein
MFDSATHYLSRVISFEVPTFFHFWMVSWISNYHVLTYHPVFGEYMTITNPRHHPVFGEYMVITNPRYHPVFGEYMVLIISKYKVCLTLLHITFLELYPLKYQHFFISGWYLGLVITM